VKIIPSTTPPGPAGRPLILKPVRVTMDVPLYYLTDDGPTAWNHDILCSELFATTVLVTANHWAQEYGFGLVHLGFYNARQARGRNGQLLHPVRWSNHSHGDAGDFAGVMQRKRYLGIDALQAGAPAKLQQLLDRCRTAIMSEGRRSEIVDEGRWIHIGMFPPNYE
jgi:hypothetical protein